MVDFVSVNPSSGGFRVGRNLNEKMEIGSNHISVGTGLLATFVSNELRANGKYDRLGNKGDFEISVSPSGELFEVKVVLTGNLADRSRQFIASAKQVSAHCVGLFQQSGDLSMKLTQNNGWGPFHSKIDIDISWAPVSLYVMPTD
ncbi:hypothetical protein ABUK73_04285 [Agrobacterium sp. BA1120]|uniref:hypothetical protein n=1 Tax=Agrobacterium sp. BA1120 TaxID=3228927 RepID=UPI000DE0F3EB